MRHMKRFITLFSAIVLAALLPACSAKGPDLAALGWEEDWRVVGDLLAAEPVEGFTEEESDGALDASGIWYAAWSSGEEAVSEDFGTYYGAEIFLLVQECKNEAEAQSTVKSWSGYERASFTRGEAQTQEYAGQAFQICPLRSSGGQGGSPYFDGMEAFAVRGNVAVSVELLCQEGFSGDREALLAAFLSGLHYNDKEG